MSLLLLTGLFEDPYADSNRQLQRLADLFICDIFRNTTMRLTHGGKLEFNESLQHVLVSAASVQNKE